MIEEVQDTYVDILNTNLAAELSGLESPSGGVSLTLAAPAKYLINFEPGVTVIPSNYYPCCIVWGLNQELDDEIRTGICVTHWHDIAVVMCFLNSAGKTPTDAINAVENIQRMRSRYARAVIGVLKEHQQTDPIQMIKIENIDYSRVLHDQANKALLSFVWIKTRARERETL